MVKPRDLIKGAAITNCPGSVVRKPNVDTSPTVVIIANTFNPQ
jgi:hypothetical protein